MEGADDDDGRVEYMRMHLAYLMKEEAPSHAQEVGTVFRNEKCANIVRYVVAHGGLDMPKEEATRYTIVRGAVLFPLSFRLCSPPCAGRCARARLFDYEIDRL